MITPEQVTLAYQLLLGRDPESAEIINNLCQTVHSVGQLRDTFMRSSEFRQRMGEILENNQYIQMRHPFHLPQIPVEVNVSNEALKKLFDRIQREWQYLGETEPYWSTITQPQYHIESFESNREQFYQSGKHVIEIYLAALRRNGINPNGINSLLEVGCGVGRVTQYLAQHFPVVTAADISAAHISVATAHIQSLNITNVDFIHLKDPSEFLDLKTVDAIISVITLQHNSPPIIAWIFKNLLLTLNSGGVAFIQIPTYKSGYFFEAGRYLETSQPNTLEMHFLPQHEIFKIIQSTDCVCLEIREDGMVGDEVNMLSNTFLIRKN